MKYLSKYDEFDLVLHRSVVMKAHLSILRFFLWDSFEYPSVVNRVPVLGHHTCMTWVTRRGLTKFNLYEL